MRTPHGLLIVATLAAACEVAAPLGVIRKDASEDAPVDAPGDVLVEASDDVLVDAPDDVTTDAPSDGQPRDADASLTLCEEVRGLEPELTGLGSGLVAIDLDTPVRNGFYRLYYVAADGTLRVDLRRPDDDSLECEQNLGTPPGGPITGAPTVATQHNVVVVPVRDESRCAALWAREVLPGDGGVACGGAYSGWAALPAPPVAMASGPAAVGLAAPVDATLVVVTSVGGDLMLYERFDTAGLASGQWTIVPARPSNLRAIGRPAVSDWGEFVYVFALTESARGTRSFRFAIYDSLIRRWTDSWVDHPFAVDDPPVSTPRVVSQSIGTPAIMWLAYEASGQRILVQQLHDTAGSQVWGDWWTMFPVSASETSPRVSLTLALVTRGAGASGREDGAVMVAVPHGQRDFYLARRDATTTWFGPWRRAPDDLR